MRRGRDLCQGTHREQKQKKPSGLLTPPGAKNSKGASKQGNAADSKARIDLWSGWSGRLRILPPRWVGMSGRAGAEHEAQG
ncbi:hypothetical protein GCM10011586_00510 [Silvibacterium dinghuense]|nr:hypothetical protein GCM10011586_00510 [Silvibacterium dinghuense]